MSQKAAAKVNDISLDVEGLSMFRCGVKLGHSAASEEIARTSQELNGLPARSNYLSNSIKHQYLETWKGSNEQPFVPAKETTS